MFNVLSPHPRAPSYSHADLVQVWTTSRDFLAKADDLFPFPGVESEDRRALRVALAGRLDTVKGQHDPHADAQWIVSVEALSLRDLADRSEALEKEVDGIVPWLLPRFWKGHSTQALGAQHLKKARALWHHAPAVPGHPTYEQAARSFLDAMRFLADAYEHRDPLTGVWKATAVLAAIAVVMTFLFTVPTMIAKAGAERVRPRPGGEAEDPTSRRREHLQAPPGGGPRPPANPAPLPACDATLQDEAPLSDIRPASNPPPVSVPVPPSGGYRLVAAPAPMEGPGWRVVMSRPLQHRLRRERRQFGLVASPLLVHDPPAHGPQPPWQTAAEPALRPPVPTAAHQSGLRPTYIGGRRRAA